MKINNEAENDDDAKPEGRNSQNPNREDAHQVIPPRVLFDSGDRSERHREKNRDKGRHQGELDAKFETNGDLVGDRLPGPHRSAEIESAYSPNPINKLLPYGLVEAELRAFAGDRFLRRISPAAGIFEF